MGRNEFFVPSSVRLFEEEPDEPALELGTLAAVKREARSGHLGAELKVDELALLGDVPVGLFVVLQGGSVARPEGLDVVLALRPAATSAWGRWGCGRARRGSAFPAPASALLIRWIVP